MDIVKKALSWLVSPPSRPVVRSPRLSDKTPEELTRQHLAFTFRPAGGPPFKSSVKRLVIPRAVKHYLETGEVVNLVNRAAAKKFILEWANHTRCYPFKRVASYVPAGVHAVVLNALENMQHPRSFEQTVEELERAARAHAQEVVARNPWAGNKIM